MAIADLEARAADVPWRTCHTCHALDNLDADKAARLRALLANPRVRYTELSQALATDPEWTIDGEPIVIPDDTLARHAKGRCGAKERLR